MITALTIIGIVTVYLIGFTIGQVINYRGCGNTDHSQCYDNYDQSSLHATNTFLSGIWPLMVIVGVPAFIFWLPFGGATKIAKRLATQPSWSERKAAREAALVERKARIEARTRELEAEIRPYEEWSRP